MQKVLLLLLPGFEFLEAAAFTDVFGWNLLLGDKNSQIVTAGPALALTASFGGQYQPGLLLQEVQAEEYAALAVPGGFSRFGFFRAMEDPAVQQLIRQFHRAAKPIAAVCTGAIALSRAGILQGRKATTYWIEQGYYQRDLEQGGARYQRQPLVRDGHILTGQNPAAAVPLALLLLSLLSSAENAAYVAGCMGVAPEVFLGK